MNVLFLKNLAAKTHRGLRGRVEQGRSGGGLCYGYDVVKATDDAGEPLRGERTVNEQEADVVRRVFRDFAAGISPRAIAKRLNDEGIPGPSDRLWNDSTVRGHAKRGAGLLNNELYIGRLVWNRLRYVKNPSRPASGYRGSTRRTNGSSRTCRSFGIVDDALWRAVKNRQERTRRKARATVITAVRQARANRLNGTHRPRHLLSGPLECGVCGGSYAMRGQARYGCSNHVMNGSCVNGRGIRRTVLDEAGVGRVEGETDGARGGGLVQAGHGRRRNRLNRLNRERRASGEEDRQELAGGEEEDEGDGRRDRGRRITSGAWWTGSASSRFA